MKEACHCFVYRVARAGGCGIEGSLATIYDRVPGVGGNRYRGKINAHSSGKSPGS